MDLQIVYILTSTAQDYYLEQTLLSMYSLRLHNPNANIILVTDKESEKTFVGSRSLILKYTSKVLIFDTPEGYSNMKKSRFLKTNLRSLISGDYLFIDGDTIVCDSLEGIEAYKGDICAVADKHVILKQHNEKDRIKKVFKETGTYFDPERYYINSGVMLVRDTPVSHKLYNLWYEKWKANSLIGINIDQPALAYADRQLNHPVSLISGIWNCQIIENGLKYLYSSHIIHYFASRKANDNSSPYLLSSKKIYEDLRKKGKISDFVHDLCITPKDAFNEISVIVNSNDYKYLHSPVNAMYLYHRKEYDLIERICKYRILFSEYLKKIIK